MTMFGKFSRRHFAKLAGLSALGIAAAPADAAAQPASAQPGPASFPKDFVWGTATSAYQIEGAVNVDGRGRSIWDTFAHTPGKIEDHTTGDRANEHYIRYKEDIGLIRELGAKAYRFSIAWPRVFPEGTGKPNPKGLDFYDRLIDELLKNGIEPYATLYHWDLPQALEDRVGGWRSSETSKAFADYAGYVAARITDRVRSIFTINEAGRFVNFGYGWGIDAPGLKLPDADVNQVRHHVALAHGLAVQAIRAHGRAGTKVGPAENIAACVPAFDTPENVRAADTAPGWRVLPFPASFPHMNSEWLRVGPETIYWASRLAAKVWNIETIYISENGTSSEDKVHADGQVYDLDRIMYLRNYLRQLQRATSEGVPVRGYFLWSLMDNFEWIFGYGQRFGIYHVDFRTQRRTPKLSAAFYRDVVARNAIG